MEIREAELKEILSYFPLLTERQQIQLSQLRSLYEDWNGKINVISRKDIGTLYERHVLHSLAIAKFISFAPESHILDLGTGGGFPGVPLAIMFPKCKFRLIDSIGKKIRVVNEIVRAIGLENVTAAHLNAKEDKGKYDFIVSRAVMPAKELVKIGRKNISEHSRNKIDNGFICLKGGNLDEETAELNKPHQIVDISTYFSEPFFETKKILYIISD